MITIQNVAQTFQPTLSAQGVILQLCSLGSWFVVYLLSVVPSIHPHWQNIRRGGYIAAIVGLCILPWNLLKSSNNFTSYLSAYSVFLSSIAGVMVRVFLSSVAAFCWPSSFCVCPDNWILPDPQRTLPCFWLVWYSERWMVLVYVRFQFPVSGICFMFMFLSQAYSHSRRLWIC